MQQTGMVRKIDDLGRLVLPKEIRKNLRIRNGDYLEFIMQNEYLILKKHSKLKDLTNFSQELVDSVYQFLKHDIFIADKDKIIAYSGNDKKKYLGQEISYDLENAIQRRESLLENHIKYLSITKDIIINCSYVRDSIIVEGDAVGIIVMFSEDNKLTDSDMRVIKILSSFLNKYLEN